MYVCYITICHIFYANIDIYATNAKYLFSKKTEKKVGNIIKLS